MWFFAFIDLSPFLQIVLEMVSVERINGIMLQAFLVLGMVKKGCYCTLILPELFEARHVTQYLNQIIKMFPRVQKE